MNAYDGQVQIYQLIEGAKQARGLTVVIDVFRAFSLEAYLFSWGVKEIRPVGTIEEAFRLKELIPGSVLVGERKGKKCEGFDFGNSPCSIPPEAVKGKTIIHTTSSGTQGIVNAMDASEIVTGSLLNAGAVAKYIQKRQPEQVSIVAMGGMGVKPAAEDDLCAAYIKSMLEGAPFSNLEEKIKDLKEHGGQHFFDPAKRDVFPEEDFWMCTKHDQFSFVIQVDKDELGYLAHRIDV